MLGRRGENGPGLRKSAKAITAIGFMLVLAAVAGVAWGPRVTVKSEANFPEPETGVTVASINIVQEPAWPVTGMLILGATLVFGGLVLSRHNQNSAASKD